MKPKLSALALKHEAFVLALLSGMTAADAARKAGYGRKRTNVRIVAWELLQRPDIQARLTEVMKATTDESILSIHQIKQVLSQIARARLKDYQNSDGSIRPLDGDVPNPAAIESVEYRWDSVRKEAYPWRIKLRDPVDAIVELCRLDGAYKKKPMTVQLAPITSVSVDQARSKISAHLETVVVEAEDVPLPEEGVDGQQMNSTILSGQHERLSSRPLLEEGKGSNNTEVTHGRQRKGTTSIFPSQIG